MAHDRYVLASFDSADSAAEAYDELIEKGYEGDAVSVITTEESRDEMTEAMDHDDDVEVGEGMAAGAALGGLTGLLVSAVPLAIAGLPSLVVVGPLAAALGLTGVAGTTVTGATAGALTGGLYGALDHLGMDEDEVEGYEETVKEGGIVFGVAVDEDSEDEVKDILADNGGDDVRVGTAKV